MNKNEKKNDMEWWFELMSDWVSVKCIAHYAIQVKYLQDNWIQVGRVRSKTRSKHREQFESCQCLSNNAYQIMKPILTMV
jgi:hypothetical protein